MTAELTYTTPGHDELDLTTPEGLRQLDAQIFRNLGNHLVNENKFIYITAPDGQQRGGFEDYLYTPQQVWSAALKWDGFIPFYSTDANAALQLVADTDFGMWHYGKSGEGWGGRVNYDFTGGVAPIPALAISLAWLAYDDARKAVQS